MCRLWEELEFEVCLIQTPFEYVQLWERCSLSPNPPLSPTESTQHVAKAWPYL